MVPVIRDAGRLSFRQFLDAYNALVEKARTNTLSADDLDRREHLADQPGRDRHGRLGAAADGRAGHDRRHRLDLLPRRARGDRRADRRREGHDHDLDLRPPDHPGRRVRPLPEGDRGVPAGRARLLRGGLQRARREPAGAAGQLGTGVLRRRLRRLLRRPRPSQPQQQPHPARSCCRRCRPRPRCSRPTACTAIWPPSSIRSGRRPVATRRSIRPTSGSRPS